MREILNRYTLGGLTAVYRREGDIVELLLVPHNAQQPHRKGHAVCRADCTKICL